MAGIPKILENIVDFLKNQSFQLYENPRLDDRVNSANHKNTIFKLLQESSIRFTIPRYLNSIFLDPELFESIMFHSYHDIILFNPTNPNMIFLNHNTHSMHNWFDFSFFDGNIPCPVKIKISKPNTADNLDYIRGIYYALRGELPKCPITYSKFPLKEHFERLIRDIKENDNDYYFLIVNKNNPKDIFATSLKQLHSIIPNGDNPPFQAKWDDNRVLVQRTFDEAKDFILSAFEESLRLRADANP